jgi:hypothetical protein
VGNKQKKIDISIPNLDHFIHKVYIHVARKVYMNVYLFEKNISPLQSQKNNRELEMVIQECILTAIRESIPTEAIIRAYMEEGVEQEEEVIIEKMEDPVIEPAKTETGESTSEKADSSASASASQDETPPIVPSIQNIDNEPVITRLTFNDFDAVLNEDNKVDNINAPKTIERLEEISTSRAIQRKLEEESSDDEEDRIKIHTSEPIDLSGFEILDDNKSTNNGPEIPLLDFEELP